MKRQRSGTVLGWLNRWGVRLHYGVNGALYKWTLTLTLTLTLKSYCDEMKNEGEEVMGSFLEETGKKTKRFELSFLLIQIIVR